MTYHDLLLLCARKIREGKGDESFTSGDTPEVEFVSAVYGEMGEPLMAKPEFGVRVGERILVFYKDAAPMDVTTSPRLHWAPIRGRSEYGESIHPRNR